jgi:hypothetical protein
LKSGSSTYMSLRSSKPNVLTLNSYNSKHFLLKASATLSAIPEMCLITNVKFCIYSTHLRCLWFNFSCWVKNCNTWLSLYRINYFWIK